MRLFSLPIVGLLLIAIGANAQQRKSFISPEMALSRELFPKSEDSVEMPRLIMIEQRTTYSLQPTPGSNTIQADYNWTKDIRRTESFKKAAYYQYNYDVLGRSPLPDASRDVMQQTLMKSPR